MHRATQLLHRQQDSTSSSMAHCCMGIGDPADSGSTAIDDRKKYPSETSSAFQLAVVVTNAQATLLVKGYTLCDVDQSSHKSFLVRAWPV